MGQMTPINQHYEVRKLILLPYCCRYSREDEWWPIQHHQSRLAVSLGLLVALMFCHCGKLATPNECICHTTLQPSKCPGWGELWLMLTGLVTGTWWHFISTVKFLDFHGKGEKKVVETWLSFYTGSFPQNVHHLQTYIHHEKLQVIFLMSCALYSKLI